MSSNQPEAIDLTYVRAFLPDAPDEALEFIAQLEEIFRTSSSSSLDAIRIACCTLDEKRLREAAHSLKGACLSIGARAMADLLLRLEKASAPRDWDSASTLHGELTRESLRVPEALSMLRRVVAAGAGLALPA